MAGCILVVCVCVCAVDNERVTSEMQTGIKHTGPELVNLEKQTTPFWGVCFNNKSGEGAKLTNFVSCGQIDTVCLADTIFIRVIMLNGDTYLYAPGTLTEIWLVTEKLIRESPNFNWTSRQ